MKTIRFTSKKAQYFIRAYMNSEYKDIAQVYKTYSKYKHLAQMDCLYTMSQEEGFGFRILSWNRFIFTCAWHAKNGLRIKTPCNSYYISLPFNYRDYVRTQK